MVHPSYLNERRPGERHLDSYERLEFLGDAVLDVVITWELFRRCPDSPEGQLTKLRSSLVRGRSLSKLAQGLELGQYLKLGKGEESTGGRDRDSNLADTFEALVGAIFLDRGFDTAKKFLLETMRDEIDGLLAQGVPEDPKSRLQELVQAMGEMPPRYRLVEAVAPVPDGGFDVEVLMGGQVMGRGQGKRKVDAERHAAREAMHRIENSAAG